MFDLRSSGSPIFFCRCLSVSSVYLILFCFAAAAAISRAIAFPERVRDTRNANWRCWLCVDLTHAICLYFYFHDAYSFNELQLRNVIIIVVNFFKCVSAAAWINPSFIRASTTSGWPSIWISYKRCAVSRTNHQFVAKHSVFNTNFVKNKTKNPPIKMFKLVSNWKLLIEFDLCIWIFNCIKC